MAKWTIANQGYTKIVVKRCVCMCVVQLKLILTVAGPVFHFSHWTCLLQKLIALSINGCNYHEGETDPSGFRVWWNSSALRDIVRITLPATVSWLPIPDGDPCGPPSDVSALCHVRTAPLTINPSRLPVRVHGTSCRSVYVTLGYR